MRKISILLSLAVILASCGQDFKKGQKGFEYKLISEGKGATVKSGDLMQLHISNYYNDGKKDSVLNDTRKNGTAIIISLDSTSVPAEYFGILVQMKKGDSAVIRVLTDSMFSKNIEMMPKFMKKGGYIYTTVRLLDIFKTPEQAQKAQMLEMEKAHVRDSINNIAIFEKENKELKDLFTKKNISPVKAPKGTYVLITKPGIGPMIDTSVVVLTNYTGRTLDGKMFDSNTDPSKGHVEPFRVNMTTDNSLGGGVIPGWMDGLTMLNKGAVAKFYIPSPLGYGSAGAGADIAPNSILEFDIEVLDVISKEQARKENEARIAERKARQQRFLDSMAKAKPDTSRRK